jgi:LPXTG-site transpeptidase (sortase) family protein
MQEEPESTRAGKPQKRRSWIRWVANLMILGGVICLPGYFLGTCACTALHQRELTQQLQQSNPQMAATLATIDQADFVSAESTETTALPDSATAAEIAAAEAAALVEAARAERLEAFKAAADAFAAQVGGKLAEPIGTIIIPSIGVDVVMVEGTGKGDLKEGPGHWEEKPFPGQGGNFVVSGHRTTYGAPFFHLDEVQEGDEIQLVLPYAIVNYTVTSVFIVYPDEVETVRSVGKEQISLAACHPIYSAKQRIVVQGDLASFVLVEPES